MNPNNQSLPDSSATNSCTSDNEFSLENVVGMFLTLSLCLLTQPYGSLLYSPPYDDGESKFMQRVFIFWRLNPLSCVAESVVICFTLIKALGAAIKDGVLPELRGRFPFYRSRSDRNRRWRKHWHVNAAALLLLRANDHDGGRRGDRDLLERLLSPGFLEEPVSATDGRASGREVDATSRQISEQMEMETIAAAATSSEPEPGVLRRRTSTLEAGIPTEDSLSDEKLSQLRKALGTNVLAHKEKWVDLVTTFSVLVVMVKLAATTLPWDIRVASAFILTGWSSVQLLLYLFHLHELDDEVALLVIKSARTHKAELENKWIDIIISAVIAGPLVYVGYCAGFKNRISGDNYHERSLAVELLQVPVLCMYLVAFCAVILVPLVIPLSIILAIVFTFMDMTKMVGAVLMAMGSFGAGIGYFALLDKIWETEKGSAWMAFITNLVDCAGTVLILSFFLLGPMRSNKSANDLQACVLVNSGLAFYIFAELLVVYSPSGTYKPIFLDYLG